MPNSDVAKAFKLLTLGGVILILLAGGFVLERLSRFNSRVASLKEQGQPVCYADLTHEVEEGKSDALPLLFEAAPSANAFFGELSERQLWRKRVSEDLVEQFEELAATYPDLFPLLSKASQCEDISISISDGKLPENDLHRVPFQAVSEVMQLRIRVLAAQGKPDDAVRAGIELLRLSRLLEQHTTTLVGRFTTTLDCRKMAVYALHDVLVAYPISDAVRLALNEELELHGSMDAFNRSIPGERAAVIETIGRQAISPTAFNGMAALDYFEDLQRHCQQPVIRLAADFHDFDMIENRTSWFAQSVAPGYRNVLALECLAISEVRALRIISALQTVPDGTDRDAWDREYLDSIGVPEKMTIDILTGDAMIVRRQDDQWLVYSVGKNGIDDQGRASADHGLPGLTILMRPLDE
ncbi:MAG: hypothetical protein ACR2NP_21995 [Pirellulaceae bacterium]